MLNLLKMVLKRIKNRKSFAITTVMAMICIFIIVPLGIHFSQESKLAVELTIEEHGRGSYDLLVRPGDSRTAIESELGVVEENYIGDSSGGISLSEWEEMKQHPEIEIAAPVASLGYFAGNKTSVQLPYLDQPARFTWQFYTSDGLREFPVGERNVLTYFEGDDMFYSEYFAHNPQSIIGWMGIRLPSNYYLVTAIDIESEMKLTGIDYSDLNKSIEEAPNSDALERWIEDRGSPPVIPVLQRDDLNIPLFLSLTVESLNASLTEYKKKYNVNDEDPIYLVDLEYEEELARELESEPAVSTEHYTIDLSTSQQPFNGTYVKITNDFEVEEGQGGSLSNDTGIYYTASKIDYQISGNGNVQAKIVEDGEPPAYKEVTEQGYSYLDTYPFTAPFIIWQMGTFTVPEGSNQLAASPLGFYSSEEVATTDGTTLTTTIHPGSFIAAPAAGVTTIEAAEIVKGEKPIDAVRIRVAGIESYNSEAQDKIEKVAIDLLNKGYEVDIVAGSSFKKLEMDVEGIGVVSAPWTTLGVAQSLTAGWNEVALINTILFAVFGIVWFGSRLLYERNAIGGENTVLAMIGWPKAQIRFRNWLEQSLLLSVAFIISLLSIILMDISQGLMYYGSLILWTVSLLFVLVIFSRNSRANTRTEAFKAGASLFYYRNLILPVFFVLTIAVILIEMQVMNLWLSFAEAKQTTLGAFAMDQLSLLNLFVLMATVLLTIVSVSEALNAIFYTRKAELQMYQTIGWKKSMIRKHLAKEVAIWGGGAVLLGTIISVALMLLFGMKTHWLILIGLGVCIIGMVLLVFSININNRITTKNIRKAA